MGLEWQNIGFLNWNITLRSSLVTRPFFSSPPDSSKNIRHKQQINQLVT